jgi:hypothetical protein
MAMPVDLGAATGKGNGEHGRHEESPERRFRPHADRLLNMLRIYPQ